MCGLKMRINIVTVLVNDDDDNNNNGMNEWMAMTCLTDASR